MVSEIIKGIWIGVAAAAIGAIAAIVGIIAIFFFAIIGALMGAVTGFILQYVPVLGPLVIRGFEAIGIQNPDLVSLGAMLGFVGGFFKSQWSSQPDWRREKY